MSSKHRRTGGPRPAGRPVKKDDEPAFAPGAVWVCLALILAILVVYAPVRHFPFVTYDDPEYVQQNPAVGAGLSWAGLGWALTATTAANWHPLTWVSHMLDVQIYGLSAGGHHMTSVLLHIANTLLLFGLLVRMTGMLGRSGVVAALFAVHPLHVESVAWIAERKDVLSTLFLMLTLWAYDSYVRQPRMLRYGAMALCYTAGLMSKPMLVTLPFVLLLLDYWPLRRVSTVPLSVLVREKIPLFALAMASSVVTFLAQHQAGAVGVVDAFPLGLRIENAVVSYAAYIGQTLWPARMAVLYPYPRFLSGWTVVGSLLVLLAVSAVVIRQARQHPYLPVGWLWYLGMLVPVIGVVQVGIQSRADRYTYTPLIGVFVIAAWGAADLLSAASVRRRALPVIASIAIVGCAVTARAQVQHWENSRALWRHTLDVTTANYMAHNNFGMVLRTEGSHREATAEFIEALRINPHFALAHTNVGLALTDQGMLDDAVVHLSAAVRITPDSAEAHEGLGAALAKKGKTADAIPHYEAAIRLKPDFPEAHNNFGSALSSEGRTAEAISEFRQAVRLQPAYADAHNNLGVSLATQGHNDDALREFLEASRIKPDRADFHYNVAVMFTKAGHMADAVDRLKTALRLDPTSRAARTALDVLLKARGGSE